MRGVPRPFIYANHPPCFFACICFASLSGGQRQDGRAGASTYQGRGLGLTGNEPSAPKAPEKKHYDCTILYIYIYKCIGNLSVLVQPCATHTTLLTHAHAHHLQARIKSLKAKEQQQQAPNIAFQVPGQLFFSCFDPFQMR